MQYEQLVDAILMAINSGTSEQVKGEIRQLLTERRRFNLQTQAEILGIVGLWYQAQGNLHKALFFAQKGLRLLEANGFREKAIESLYTLLGCLHRELGEPTLARHYFSELLMTRQAVLGPHHPDLLVPLANMGGITMDLGDYTAAIDFYNQALAIALQHGGESHTDTAITQQNMADVYRKMGRYPEALSLSRKAYDVLLAHYGPDSNVLLPVLNNLAAIFLELGEQATSLDYFEKALSIGKRYFPQSHPMLAHLYHNMGCAYRDLAQHERAESLLKQALTIRLNRLQTDHPLVVITLTALGVLYLQSKDYEKAASCLDWAHRILNEYPVTLIAELCPVLSLQGQLALETGQPEKAQALFEQGLSMAQASQNMSPQWVEACQEGLARANGLVNLLVKQPAPFTG